MPESLLDQLQKRLREWFDREAKRLRDVHGVYGAEFKIRLSNPGGDDDGTLCFEASISEEAMTDLEGRVEGVRFEAGDG